jgi:hypothetical protein
MHQHRQLAGHAESISGSSTLRPMSTSVLREVTAKPESSAVIVYVPGSRPRKRYSPLDLVTNSCRPLRPETVTLTPGRGVPSLPVTVPRMLPPTSATAQGGETRGYRE